MDNPLTGMKKRQKIDSARKTLFIWVVVASIAIVVCAVMTVFLIRQMLFNFNIIGAKFQTNSTLQRNIDTFDELKKNVNKTLVGNADLARLRIAPTDTPQQVVIDALPTTDDRAALGASLQQKVLAGAGVRIDSLAVADGTSGAAAPVATDATAAGNNALEPAPIEFDITLSGNYDQLKAAVENLQRSIRPFDILSMKIDGSGDTLKAALKLRTYYLPAKTVQLQKEMIKP